MFLKKYICLILVIISLQTVIFATTNNVNIDTEVGSGEEYLTNVNNVEYDSLPTYTYKNLKGEIIEAGPIYEEGTEHFTLKYQDVKVYIKDQGYTTTKIIKYSISYYTDSIATNPELKVGDKVYVYTVFDENGKIIETEIAYRNNNRYLLAIVILYAIVIVLIGGVKGVKSLISLILTVLAVFLFIMPQINEGKDPILVTVTTSAFIVVIVISIISGFNKKSLAAIIGTIGGIVVAGVFAIVFGNLMCVSGVTEEARMLLASSEDMTTIDFKGILFSGIIIGALGACMDVGMSISSALYEIKSESPDITTNRMIKAGMNIGKDMIGTMTNTLILAYVGGAIIMIMVFMGRPELTFYDIINQEMIVEEILRAIAGSFGLVVTIPITTVTASVLMGNKKEDVSSRKRKRL